VVGFVEPRLPSPAKQPLTGPNWLHEIKHDGFRILARRDASGVRLFTRNGHDIGKRFPLVVAAVAALPARSLPDRRRSHCERPKRELLKLS
jgi:ATP-dependent DNA ligase